MGPVPRLSSHPACLPARPQPLERVWRECRPQLFASCIHIMGGNLEEAEEAFGRASLMAAEKYTRHAKRIRNPRHWLTRLFINTALSLLRERRRQRWQAQGGATGAEDVARPGAETPEDTLARHRLARTLSQGIAALPVRLRASVELRLVEETPYPDIARRLHISEQNARKRVQDGRKLLRHALERYHADAQEA